MDLKSVAIIFMDVWYLIGVFLALCWPWDWVEQSEHILIPCVAFIYADTVKLHRKGELEPLLAEAKSKNTQT